MKAIAVLLVAALILFAETTRFTDSAAAITVPGTSSGADAIAITPNDLKPAICSGITLTAVSSSSGVINGTAVNELIVGSALVDTIEDMGSDDCIISGDGDDLIDGGDGADVLSGGAGDDTVSGGTEVDTLYGSGDTDVCTGGGDGDAFPAGDCETQNP
jgi:Ca2+-binding RTX toxin-like protein